MIRSTTRSDIGTQAKYRMWSGSRLLAVVASPNLACRRRSTIRKQTGYGRCGGTDKSPTENVIEKRHPFVREIAENVIASISSLSAAVGVHASLSISTLIARKSMSSDCLPNILVGGQIMIDPAITRFHANHWNGRRRWPRSDWAENGHASRNPRLSNRSSRAPGNVSQSPDAVHNDSRLR